MKRFLSMLLAVLMIISLFPTAAFAEEVPNVAGDDQQTAQTVDQDTQVNEDEETDKGLGEDAEVKSAPKLGETGGTLTPAEFNGATTYDLEGKAYTGNLLASGKTVTLNGCEYGTAVLDELQCNVLYIGGDGYDPRWLTASNVEVTIRDGHVTNIPCVYAGAKLIIEGGQFDGAVSKGTYTSIKLYSYNPTVGYESDGYPIPGEPDYYSDLVLKGGMFKYETVAKVDAAEGTTSETCKLSNFVANGYELVEIKDGEDGYADGYRYKVEAIPPVAKIGDIQYATMADAVAEWTANGGTLKLLANVEYGNSSDQRVNLRDKTDFVLDLNGFTWDAGSENSPIDVYSALEIKDSSTDKTGKIECDFGSGTYNYVVFVEEGKSLTVSSGKIVAKNGASKAGCIYGASSATINIAGGELSGEFGSATNTYAINAVSGCTVNVSAGKICASGGSGGQKAGGIYVASGATANISGGEIIDNCTSNNGCHYAVEYDGAGEITGGKIDGAVWAKNGQIKGGVYSAKLNKEWAIPALGYKFKNNSEDATYIYKVVEAVTSLSGSGTQTDPFLINNIDDLEFFRDQINAGNATYYGNAYQGKYFALTADIDLNGDNWTPIGNSSHSFTGHFDGRNHTISNLYVNTTNSFAGLFGYTGDQVNVSIKNLTIDNANVTGNQFAGAVVGENKQYITLDNVHVTGIVKIMTIITTAGDAGGIIGKTIGGTNATNCSTIADANSGSFVKTSAVNKSASAGGIMGFMAGDCSADCYFVNCHVKNVDLTSYNRVGGVVGTIQKSDGQLCHKYVTNCSVENVNVTVTGPNDLSNYSNRHDAQGGLIVGCSAGTDMRYLNIYSNNTYSGNCSLTASSGATDIILTQLYGLWSLGHTRAADIGQTYGTKVIEGLDGGDCVITYASAQETGEVQFNGTYYKTFLSAYHSNGAGKTGSSEAKPFKLMTDVGYSLVIGDAIYVDNDGNHIFYPRTDEEGYRVKTTAIGGNVTLYELETDPNVTFVASLTVGDTVKGYTTLEKAFAAAPTNGTACTITVLENCTCGKTITAAGTNITLELNGKTVENTTNSAMIYVRGTLTVQDNTDTEKNGTGYGKIWVHPAAGNAMVLATYGDNSVININSGYILAESSNATAQTVYTSQTGNNAGKVNANGGLIEAKVASGQLGYALRINNIDTAKEGTEFVLNGATLKGNSDTSYLIYNQSYFRGARMSLVKGTIISTGKDAGTYNEVRTTGNDVSYDIKDIVADGSYRVKVDENTYKVVDYVGKIGNVTYKTLAGAAEANPNGLTGGEFYADPTGYVNNDYKAVKRADNVTDIWDVVPKNYVAKIGETKYESLAEAIAVVTADNTETTITMVGNTVENVTIPANKNIVLDLNGKTIDGNKAGSVITVAKNGELTVKDSTVSETAPYGTGKITNGLAGQGGGINVAGKLTLESGQVVKNQANGGGSFNGGGIHVSGTFEMRGGSVSENEALNHHGGGIVLEKPSSGGIPEGTISGGLISKNETTSTEFSNQGGGIAVSNAKLTISGGTISENVSTNHGGGIMVAGSNSVVTISGGTITKNTSGNQGGGVCATAGKTTITGDANIFGNSAYAGDDVVANQYGELNITGGTIGNGTEDYSLFVHYGNRKAVTISGNPVFNGKVHVDYAKTPNDGGAASITGGKFKKEVTSGGYEGFISGGYYVTAPAAALIASGYQAVALLADDANYAAGYRYTIDTIVDVKEPTETEINTMIAATDEELDDTQKGEIKEQIESLIENDNVSVDQNSLINAVNVDKIKENVEDESASVTTKIEIELEKIEVKPVVVETVSTFTLNTAEYQVTPIATITTTKTVGGETITQIATRTLTNDEISGGVIVRLAVPQTSAKLAKITHTSNDPNYPTEEFYAQVKGDSGEQYVEITMNHFSSVKIELMEGELVNPVAAIGTTGYATLQAAFDAATDGDTVFMLENVTNSSDYNELYIDKAITFNLGGKTLTGAKAAGVLGIANNVTIENGTIANNTSGLTVNAVVMGTGSLNVKENVTFTINVGTTKNAISGTDGYMGDAVLASGTYGGEIKANSITISGGTYNGAVRPGGVLNISGGVFNANVVLNSGDCTITGGTFNSNVTVPNGSISGGKFKSKPADSKLAEGYCWTEADADGYYSVQTAEASANGKNYATLAEAVTAANGTPVKLLANDLSYTLSIGQTIIVNENYKTGFTVTGPTGFTVKDEKESGTSNKIYSLTINTPVVDKYSIGGVYTGTDYTSSITNEYDDAVSFKWFKGEATEACDTDKTLNLKNVADTATYTVKAYADGYESEGTTVEVEITKAEVKIYVDDASKTYGDADPAFAAKEITGLVNGETLIKDTDYTLGRSEMENVGTIQITMTPAENTKTANYDITGEPGTFTITKKPVTVTTYADPATIIGGQTPTYKYSIQPALVGQDSLGEIELSSGYDTASDKTVGGEYDIEVTFDGNATSANTNYDVTVTNGKLTVTGAVAYIDFGGETGRQYYATLADAIDAADDFDNSVINLLPGNHDMSSLSFNNFGSKTVTFKGAGQGQTIVNWGSGLHYASSVNLKMEDLTLEINHSLSGGSVYTHYVQHSASEEYKNVTIKGMIVTDHTVLFDNCTFAGSTTGDEYLLWSYGGDVTVKDCTFGNVDKGAIKLYTDMGDSNLTLLGTNTFNDIGSKGCAVYSSNDHYTAGAYDIITEDSTIVLPEGEEDAKIVSTGSKGVSTLNATKTENGYTGGTFFGSEANIETKLADGFAPQANEDGSYTPVPTVAKIGTVDYSSLDKALAAAQANDTVVLCRNVETTGFAVPENVTLDLGGKTVTPATEGFTGITNNGTIKLYAANADQLGYLLYNAGGSYAAAEAFTYTKGSESYVVPANTTVNANGTTLTIVVPENAELGWNANVKTGYVLNVTGKVKATSLTVEESALINSGDFTAVTTLTAAAGTIAGGTFNRRITNAELAEGKVCTKSGSNYVVNDGEFVAEVIVGTATSGEKYATLTEAFAAVSEMTGNVTLKILQDITESGNLEATLKGKLTITADSPKTVDINGGIKFINGSESGTDELIIENNITIKTAKDCNFHIGATAKPNIDVTINGTVYADIFYTYGVVTVTTQGKLLGYTYSQHTSVAGPRGKLIVNGSAAAGKAKDADVQFSLGKFRVLSGGIIEMNNTHVKIISDSASMGTGSVVANNTYIEDWSHPDRDARFLMEPNAVFELKNGSVYEYCNPSHKSQFSQLGTLKVDYTSALKNLKELQFTGSTIVDVTGMTDADLVNGKIVIIDYYTTEGTADYAKYSLTGNTGDNADYVLAVIDNDLCIIKGRVAVISGTTTEYFYYMDDALVAAQKVEGTATVKVLTTFSDASMTNHKSTTGQDGYVFTNNLIITAEDGAKYTDISTEANHYKAALVAAPGATITFAEGVEIVLGVSVGNYHYHENNMGSFDLTKHGAVVINGDVTVFSIHADNIDVTINKTGSLKLTQENKLFKPDDTVNYNVTGNLTSAPDSMTGGFEVYHDNITVGDAEHSFGGALNFNFKDTSVYFVQQWDMYGENAFNVTLNNSYLGAGYIDKGGFDSLDMKNNSVLRVATVETAGGGIVNLPNGATLTAGSKIFAEQVTVGEGKNITVDMSAATADSYLIVDDTNSNYANSDLAMVTLTGVDDTHPYVLKVVDGNICAVKAVAAITNGGSTTYYEHIQNALPDARNNTGDGKTIKVLGVETQSTNFNGNNEGITLMGVAGNEIKADFGADGSAILKNVTLKNLTFDHAKVTFSTNVTDYTNFTIEGCTFNGPAGTTNPSAITINRNSTVPADGIKITGNTIKDFTEASSTAILIGNSATLAHNVVISNNVIDNVTQNGIQALGIDGLTISGNTITNDARGAINLSASKNVTLTGNTISIGSAEGKGFALTNVNTGVVIVGTGNTIKSADGMQTIDLTESIVEVEQNGVVVLNNTKGETAEFTEGTFIAASKAAVNAVIDPAKAAKLMESKEETYVLDNAVAVVNDDLRYDTLAAAIAAAQSGDTIKMLDNVTLTAAQSINKEVSIDLNGKTVQGDSTGAKRFEIGNGGKLTLVDNAQTKGALKGGMTGEGALIKVADGGEFVLDGANISNAIYGVCAWGSGKIEIKSGSIVTEKAAVSTNGNGGTQQVTISGGILTSNADSGPDNVAVYIPSGSATISGGTITGATGVYVKGGNVTFPENSTASVTGNGTQTGYVHGTGSVTATGDAIVLENSDYPAAPPVLSIMGGTFKSTNGKAAASYGMDGSHKALGGFVSGGEFSTVVPLAYCAEGYVPVTTPNEDGMYKVEYALPDGAVMVAPGFYQNAATYGTSTEFYITNKEGLEYFRDFINSDQSGSVRDDYIKSTKGSGLTMTDHPFMNKTVNLMTDIDLNGEPWDPIGVTFKTKNYSKVVFTGIFNGQGHTISNLKVSNTTASKYEAGLFSRLSNGGSVKNLVIENVDITNSNASYTAAVVGYIANNNCVVDNVTVTGNVDIYGFNYVGGIVGQNVGGTISNATVAPTDEAAKIESYYHVGGIAGYTAGGKFTDDTVSDVAINCTYESTGAGVAGIAGFYADGVEISGCKVDNVAITNLEANMSNAGTILGKNNGTNSKVSVLTGNTVTETTVNGETATQIGSSNKEGPVVVDVTAGGMTKNDDGKVTAGTFEQIPDSEIAHGYAKTLLNTGLYEIVAAEAAIGEVGYKDVDEALEDAQPGDTVTVFDVELLDLNTQNVPYYFLSGGETTEQLEALKDLGVVFIAEEGTVEYYDYQACAWVNHSNSSNGLYGTMDSLIEAANVENGVDTCKLYKTLGGNGGNDRLWFELYDDWTLTDDVTLPDINGCGSWISTIGNVTIDLKGNTIEQEAGGAGTGANNGWAAIEVGSDTLTIDDSVGNGKVIGAKRALDIAAGAGAVLEDGTLSSRAIPWISGDAYGSVVVLQEVGSSFTMNDGTLIYEFLEDETLPDYSAKAAIQSFSADATVTVNGGTIHALPSNLRLEGDTTGIATGVAVGTSNATIVTYVAKIGEDYYTTLAGAAAAAVDGDTIVVLEDCSTTAELNLAGVTVDLNGKNVVIGKVTVASGKEAKITDSASAKGGLTCNDAITVAGKLDVSDLGYGTAGLVPGQAGHLAIEDGGEVVLMSVWEGHTANALKNNSAAFFTGTEAGAVVSYEGGDSWTLGEDGVWTINGEVARATVSAGYLESYTTLQAALDAAKADTTVYLTADSTEAITISVAKTIDLNGNKLTGDVAVGANALDIVGTEAGSEIAGTVSVNGGTLSVNGGTYSEISAEGNSTVDINGAAAISMITITGDVLPAITSKDGETYTLSSESYKWIDGYNAGEKIVALSTSVARIGTVYFTTLQDAINAAYGESGKQTIVLVDDIDSVEKIGGSAYISIVDENLDLAGYEISAAMTMAVFGGTVSDSSADRTGTVVIAKDRFLCTTESDSHFMAVYDKVQNGYKFIQLGTANYPDGIRAQMDSSSTISKTSGEKTQFNFRPVLSTAKDKEILAECYKQGGDPGISYSVEITYTLANAAGEFATSTCSFNFTYENEAEFANGIVNNSSTIMYFRIVSGNKQLVSAYYTATVEGNGFAVTSSTVTDGNS